MNFLVLGCNGMAGHLISLYLLERGYKVEGIARKKTSFLDNIVGDISDLNFLKSIIYNGKYDAIINCAALLNEDAEKNKSTAIFLNAFLPHYITEITANMRTRIVQLSTDYVFLGRYEAYDVNDCKDGKSFYAETKALGEVIDNKNITLRTSIIGPDTNPFGKGLMNWFMQQKGIVNGYTKSFWTGQTTLQLAKTIEYAVRRNISGIYNAVPNSYIDKYFLLKLLNKYFRGSAVLIEPVENVVSNRVLLQTKFDYDYIIPDYDIMFFELSEWMKKHEYLYPHYNIVK